MTPPDSSITFTSVEKEEEEGVSSSREEQPGRPGGLGGAQGW